MTTMNKSQALYSFWSQFDWEAIDEQSAYDEAVAEKLGLKDRYITFENQTGDYTEPIALTASLWHRSTSFDTVTKKMQEIEDFIGVGGYRTPIDGGYLWITRRNPFSQHGPAESGYDMRRIILNIQAAFLTAT